MAAPAMKGPAKGNHVLFLVRNPNGIASVLSYLNSRSIKSWTATSLPDALPKIKNHNIQMVFVSLSLKNVSVPAIIESLRTQSGLPVVIFSEEVSRKTEGDMAKLVTPNKIVPPNQNAKFLKMVQQNLDAEGSNPAGGGGSNANVEDLLPANSEPIEGKVVPEEGRWLKINMNEKSVAPFTYKLMQPRNATVGRTRYFYVGPKNPEMVKEGRGWLGAPDGQFYIAGRIVEAAPDPVEPSRKVRGIQMSEEAPAGPLKTHWSTNSAEPAPDEEELIPGFTRQHLEPTPASHGMSARMSQGLKDVGENFRQHFENLASGIPDFSAIAKKLPGLSNLLEGIPGFSEIVDKVLGRAQPHTTREPASMLERKLLKAALSAVERPLKAVPLPDGPNDMVEKIGLAFIKTEATTGFVISDLNDFSDENFATFEKLIDTLKTRYALDGQAMEVLLPPSIVCVEPMPLVATAKQNDHMVIHAENETQRLVCSFVEAPDVGIPQVNVDHEKFTIPASALDSEQKILFNLYLHLPKNEKHLQYFRIGHLVPKSTIEKLQQSDSTEILIDPTSVSSYFGYTAVTAIARKKT